jgi:hypothetical protein
MAPDGTKADRENGMMTQALPAMTGAEMQCTREWLGIDRKWLSEHLVISDRRLARMEAGRESIPDAVVSTIDDIAEETKDMVHEMVADYRRKVKAGDGAGVTLLTYRIDEEYHGKYTARWHRMLSARVADAVPGLVLVHQ